MGETLLQTRLERVIRGVAGCGYGLNEAQMRPGTAEVAIGDGPTGRGVVGVDGPLQVHARRTDVADFQH